MAIEIGPNFLIGPNIGIIGTIEPQPILLLITEDGLNLQTESGDDLTTE